MLFAFIGMPVLASFAFRGRQKEQETWRTKFGDVPGRKEPGTGKIDWPQLLRAICSTGYRGFAGIEHDASEGGEPGLLKCLEVYRRLDAELGF